MFSKFTFSLIFLGGMAAAFVGTSSATAQSMVERATCGERDRITAKLSAKFQEVQQGAGVVSGKSVLEFWRSKAGSWTILMTRPDGKTCIMAAGDHWREVEGVLGDPT